MKRLLFFVVAASLVVVAVPASASPPGTGDVGHQVFNMQLIGTPGDYEGGCGGGNRVFVERDTQNSHLVWTDTAQDTWKVLWCDTTGNDGPAMVQIGDLGTQDVYIRMLGKPGGQLDVCIDVVSDDVSGDNLCYIGSFSIRREGGKSSFQVKPDSYFDADLEDVLWEMDTNSDFRNMQIKVFETA